MIRSLFNAVEKISKRGARANSSLNLVRTLSSKKRKGRLFVGGDIHGGFHVLMSALHALEFDFNKDAILLVGDIHDRGPNSANCLELLQEPWFFSTIGNHEWMLLSVVSESGDIDSRKKTALDMFIANGGEWLLGKTSEARAKWRNLLLAQVPLYWMLERRDRLKVMVCHAEPSEKYVSDVIAANNRKLGLASLRDDNELWGRNALYNAVRPYLSVNVKEQLLPAVGGVLCSMHGHSYVKTATWINNQLFLDTGTALGKKLTLVDVDHVIPGMANGIYAWNIAEEKLFEYQAMKLWPN